MNRAARVMRVAREASAAERAEIDLTVVPPVGRPSARSDAPTSFGPVVFGRGGVAAANGVYVAPRHGTVVAVTSVGGAEGSRGAAAALSCAGSGIGTAALLVDVGGRAFRIFARRPAVRSATWRSPPTRAGSPPLGSRSPPLAAVSPSSSSRRICCSRSWTSQERRDRTRRSCAPTSRRRDRWSRSRSTICSGGLRVAVLKRRLGWVAERRAGFGALGSDSGGLPEPLLRRLLGRGARG
jgi:hypothetical protein